MAQFCTQQRKGEHFPVDSQDPLSRHQRRKMPIRCSNQCPISVQSVSNHRPIEVKSDPPGSATSTAWKDAQREPFFAFWATVQPVPDEYRFSRSLGREWAGSLLKNKVWVERSLLKLTFR